MRVGVVLVAGMFAFASISAEAATRTTTKTAATKTTKKKAKAKAKKRVAAKAKAKAKAKSKKTAKRHLRYKLKSKPTVKVAVRQGDGRLKYGRDNMPPGFAWPPDAAMRTASKACEDGLDALGIKWEPAAPKGNIVDPIVVPSMEIGGIKYTPVYSKPPHTLDCQLVATLAAIGPELHAVGLREIKFGSIYRNTLVRVHGQRKNILSRHALGLAMDINAFIDAEGRIADVETEYLKGDTFLHAIEDTVNRSSRFRIVLTPGNDPISHYDHFHIEASVDFTAFR